MEVRSIIFVVFLQVGISSVKSWDIAVAVGGEVQFLNATGELAGRLSEGMTEVRALAYNSDLRRMYFGDSQRSTGSVFEVTIPQQLDTANPNVSVHTVVSRQVYQARGVAYDDMTGILYWTNGVGHAVMWVRVGAMEQPQPGQPLLTLRDQIPMGIAIDTCKRYLYWTNCALGTPSIERSLLDGSGRQALVTTDLTLPYAVVVDQATDRLYWVDERPGAMFAIESSDLNGHDRKVLISGSDHQPFALAITGNQVFWADHIHLSVYRLLLDTPHSTSSAVPLRVASYHTSPQALVSAHSGTWSHERCNPVIQPTMKVIPATVTKTVTVPPLSQRLNSSQSGVVCLNMGVWLGERGYCNCLPGYSGALCEVDECRDHCLHGVCVMEPQGPTCQCHEGFSGPRCETSVCHNYCVTGSCSVELTGQPQCHCQEGYSGQRCQVNFTQQQELRDSLHEVCSAFCKLWTQSSKENIQPFDVCSCPEFEAMSLTPDSAWHRDYSLVALLALCSLLMVAVALLTKKVFVLRKRPRIKKRIIVNKTTTPLTCRPSPAGGEQCEITIENCCNMNICETPCFEPDFRQPQATLTKSNNKGAKEEQKTLLGNMELPPDDLY